MASKGKSTTPSSEQNTSDPLTAALRDEMIIEVKKNLTQKYIVVPEDTALVLIGKDYPPDRWKPQLTILGVFLTLLIPLLTADFHDFLIFSGVFLKHFFSFSVVFCTFYLIRSVYVEWTRSSPEELVKKLGGGTIGSVTQADYSTTDSQQGIPDSSEQREDIDNVM